MSVTPRTITQATHGPPPVAASGGAPPGGPPGTGFDLFLMAEAQARTAPAEGRNSQTDATNGAVTEQDAPQGTEATAQSAEVPAAAAEAPVISEEPVAVPVAPEGEAPLDPQTSTTTGDGTATPTAPALEDAGAPQQGVEAPAAAEGGTSPTPEAEVPVLEGAGAEAGPAGPEGAVTAAPSGSQTATDEPEAPPVAETPAEEPAKPGNRPDDRPADAPGRGHGHAYGHAEGRGANAGDGQNPSQPAAAATPAAANAQAANAEAPVAPPPVQPAAPATPAPAAGPLLAPQVARAQALVELAMRRGQATANLELHPAELGKVQVRLRHGAAGLTATMTVDRPEALQALQTAADQLRQSLADKGVEVVRLDIGLSAQARGDEAKTGARSDGRDASGGTSRRGGTDAVTDHDHDDAPSTVRSLTPGALVDVRA